MAARRRYDLRRLVRLTLLAGIAMLLVLHWLPDISRSDDKSAEERTSTEKKEVDAFAAAKWSEDQVRTCEQRERKRRMKEICDARAQKKEWLCDKSRFKNMLVDDKHKAIYCEVPKAACTSWKMFFAELLGNITDDIRPVLSHKVHRTEVYDQLGFRFLSSYNEQEQIYRLQHYFKFLTLRNPLARVVSAYENKLERQHPDSYWYQQHIGSHIVKNYRKNPTEDSKKRGHDVTFQELVRFIGNENETFFQRYDRHWDIQYFTCCPCMISYDYIAKIETLAEDAKNIIEKIVPGQGLKLPHSNVMNMAKETARVQKPFQTVTQSQVDGLLKHYGLDMSVFGYGIDKERKIVCNSGGEGENACC